VRKLLRDSHRLAPNARDDFDILTMVQQSNVQRINGRWMRGMSRVLAAVTVTLGFVGVFAVSYLNVTERTAEIGLRVALGAAPFSIVSLFVSEACVLAVIGGVAGIAIGVLATQTIAIITSWPAAIDLGAVALPLAASVAMGVMCSLWPAWRASRLNPATALAG
jgi:putative ABC transport system permease protein